MRFLPFAHFQVARERKMTNDAKRLRYLWQLFVNSVCFFLKKQRKNIFRGCLAILLINNFEKHASLAPLNKLCDVCLLYAFWIQSSKATSFDFFCWCTLVYSNTWFFILFFQNASVLFWFVFYKLFLRITKNIKIF